MLCTDLVLCTCCKLLCPRCTVLLCTWRRRSWRTGNGSAAAG